ncbi:MAG: hypothetical protein Q9217_003301 [Psora testacea]
MESANSFLWTTSPRTITPYLHTIFMILWTIRIQTLALPLLEQGCPSYDQHARTRHEGNRSEGRYQLPFQRPSTECRNFYSWEVEEAIERLQYKIKDPDLFRLFENAYPNTLDTMVKWKGFAWENGMEGVETDEDLAFVITGDINAMWLRDSANQILSYTPVLIPSSEPDSLAALFRGVINAHSRYIKFSPYCHAYQPLPESKVRQQTNYAYSRNHVNPPYDPAKTFDCKWELDSLASFLQLSSEYHNVTNDLTPFEKFTWLDTVEIILNAVDAMRVGTYTHDGHIRQPGYTMTGQTDRATETTSNDGHGNPVSGHTGLIRSTFRPSDDATIFQFLIPSNMMFAVYLESSSNIMYELNTLRSRQLADRMLTMASEIRAGITKYGVIAHSQFGAMYAFEVDGYGSQNLMDDANLPSLLSASWMGYVNPRDEVYLNTRMFALSEANPYWAFGDIFNAVGGPHTGPSKGWPLASIVRAMTSQDASGDEIRHEIRAILGSTDGLGLVHESINAHNANDWSRHWFGWANGMFGQLILELEAKWPELLEESYQ